MKKDFRNIYSVKDISGNTKFCEGAGSNFLLIVVVDFGW